MLGSVWRGGRTIVIQSLCGFLSCLQATLEEYALQPFKVDFFKETEERR